MRRLPTKGSPTKGHSVGARCELALTRRKNPHPNRTVGRSAVVALYRLFWGLDVVLQIAFAHQPLRCRLAPPRAWRT